MKMKYIGSGRGELDIPSAPPPWIRQWGDFLLARVDISGA